VETCGRRSAFGAVGIDVMRLALGKGVHTRMACAQMNVVLCS
jgi:hypothetical protein